MPVYKDKSHEELRWEDYQLGDKGGPQPAAHPSGGIGFGVSTAPKSPFGSSSTFGQTSSNPFSSTSTNRFSLKPPSFTGTQSSVLAFGSTSFGQSPFGGQHGGSRVAPYTPTTEADSLSGTESAAKLESISAMPVFKDKSHEELRWKDYQLGDKGGRQPPAQPSGVIGFGVSTAPSSPFGCSSTFGQTSSNPFSSTITTPFSLKPPSFNSTGFTTLTAISNPFQWTSSSLFGPTSSSTSSIFGSSSTPMFGTGSSPFSLSVTPSFSTSPSIFGAGSAPATTPAFATGLNFSICYWFNSTPAIGQTSKAFGWMTLPLDRILVTLVKQAFSTRLPLDLLGICFRVLYPWLLLVTQLPLAQLDDEETPSTPKSDAVFIPRENSRALGICPRAGRRERAGRG